jgi:hypothetical protein
LLALDLIYSHRASVNLPSVKTIEFTVEIILSKYLAKRGRIGEWKAEIRRPRSDD